ncbi:MAG: lysylphosphatidylglycerol synthase transmembrane domain-containing protein [Candidatus Eisenbacteria bacterium]|nr:lysylphosphatidylglycerol synthase transmembrane domain-containing protein [Candidatus Eisenbacteria bacterium]
MAVLVLVTLLVFYLLFRNVSFSRVFELLGSARLAPLIAGLLLTATFPVFSAWRWQRMMDALGHPIPGRQAFSLIMACNTLAVFTPSKGSDLAKAYFLRGRAPVSTVLGSVLAERLLDVLTLLAFCLAGSWMRGWNTLALASGGLFVLGLAGTVALLTIRLPVPRKLRPKVDRLLQALRLLLGRPALLAPVLLLTLANWLASVVQTWLFYVSLRGPTPFGPVLAALPAAIFVGLLPVTLAGMGTRDAALIRLMAPVSASAVSLGVGILYSLGGYWLPGILGLPFLRTALAQRAEGR